MPKQYSVWWSTGRRDGDSSYETLADAEQRFSEVIKRPDILEAEISSTEDGDPDPSIVRRWTFDPADRD